MRLIGLFCCALLFLGCSYSPEEQYQDCMRWLSKRVSRIDPPEHQADQLLGYDLVCRVSVGMESRTNRGDFIAIAAYERGIDDLLDLFGAP